MKAHVCVQASGRCDGKRYKAEKGTYLYGTVTGFGQQRVRASITSILVGDRFIKVKLSVFDNDGMEGFYVLNRLSGIS